MSISFSSANSNQALILETFGLPTFASKEKLYTPIPCCQEAKVFQLGRSDVSFETPEFSTLDEYKIHVIGSVSYSIDAKTRSGILKAYRSLVKNKKSFYDSFKSPFKQYQALEIGAEEGIKTILSDLIVYQMEYMTFEDVVSIDLVFIDNIFERAKKTLKEYYVQLKSINFKEVIQQSERRLELAENVSFFRFFVLFVRWELSRSYLLIEITVSLYYAHKKKDELKLHIISYIYIIVYSISLKLTNNEVIEF